MYFTPHAQSALANRLGWVSNSAALRGARELLESIARLGRAAESAIEPDSVVMQPDTSLMLFQGALPDVRNRCALRERLARQRGTECFEFLISVRSFGDARNPLQRHQILSNIIHRFIRDGAERTIKLSSGCRSAILTEWAAWAESGRVPEHFRFRALEAAAVEVNALMAARQGELQ